MAVISLQLFTGQLIDTDPATDFSLKAENPFFCVGITNLAHTQDFSVPATKKNNLIFNVDNAVIMQGWRHGRKCWLGYSAGEIDGRLFIKDYDKGRYNLLFIWGAELDEILSQPIGDYTETNISITIQSPKVDDVISTFGWANYNEVYYDQSFSDGISLMPSLNLGWLMDTVAASAGYSIQQDGTSFPNVSSPQYNPYNYGINIDSVNVSNEYVLRLAGWAARANAGLWNNYQLFDNLNNPVPLSAAGLQLVTRQLQTNTPGFLPYCVCFAATREVRIKIQPNHSVICLSVYGATVTAEGNGGQFPYIEYDEVLTLNSGQIITFLAVADFDTYTWMPDYYNEYTTPLTYNCDIEDSMTVANVGDILYLDDNLPNMSLLDLIRSWCLMVSAFFVIDADSKKFLIYTHEAVIANRISSNIIDIDQDKKILNIGSLKRYINGFSQHNLIMCNSANYVADINRYRSEYPCDNDLLDEESIFGTIGYNEGNINGSGEAVFENVQPMNGGGITLKPQIGVFYFNTGGGAAYHLQWVENNYGMHVPMSAVTSGAVSIMLTIQETLAQYLCHNYDELFVYGGCMWVAKSYVWKDNATELELVKVDDAIAIGIK